MGNVVLGGREGVGEVGGGGGICWQSRASTTDRYATLWATGGDNDFLSFPYNLSSFNRIWHEAQSHGAASVPSGADPAAQTGCGCPSHQR